MARKRYAIPEYGTVVMAGTEYYRTRIEDADGKRVALYGRTREELYDKVLEAREQIEDNTFRRSSPTVKDYLFEYNGKKLNQSQYREFWADIMDKLQMEHTPHECRHTFRSRLDSAGANKVCIDRLMGHKSKGTGERVYTHKNIEELRLNIELITN